MEIQDSHTDRFLTSRDRDSSSSTKIDPIHDQATSFPSCGEKLIDRTFDGDLDLEDGIEDSNNNSSRHSNPSIDQTSMLEQSGGRDSGFSNESMKYQEIFAKERVLASHQELQEAKKKLEELRLLRFEEKTVLRQEIEQLHEKVDVGESQTSQLEGQLKILETEKLIQNQKLSDISKEQEIGSQINMMQEQEIVRMEMKLKEEEIERANLTQQLDQHRRTVIEKDKIRLKHQGENYILKERIAQLEESNIYYKNESDSNYRRARECDQAMKDLKEEMKKLQRANEDCADEVSNANIEMKMMETEKTKMAERVILYESQCEELKKKFEELTKRWDAQEKDYKNRESSFQNDLENASLNESKLADRCEELETLYHDTRREKDEQYFELTQMIERVATLEQRLKAIEDEKVDLEFDLSELRNVICRHVKPQETEKLSPSKEGAQKRIITPDEVEEFFTENSSKMYRYQSAMDNLSSQIEEERTVVSELNDTINELKDELNKAQWNMKNISSLKETLQTQQQRTSETLRIQEKDIERRQDENDRLREIISDYEKKLEMLENEVNAIGDERRQLSGSHKEERKKLKVRIHELEAQKQLSETAKRKSETRYEEEKERLDEELERKQKENDELKKELEKLIEDNKNLAKRLMHLESYSDRLSDMLEQQQSDNQRLKDKIQKDMRVMKNESGEKELEISSLRNHLGDLNRSLNEKEENEEKLGNKLKESKGCLKDVDKKNKELEAYNNELKKRLDLVSEAHMKAERKAISSTEDVAILKKRLEDQKKAMEELFNGIKSLEEEKGTLKANLMNSEKRIHMKEELIDELTKKTGKAAENFNSLRSSLEKAEVEGKQYEQKFFQLRQNKMSLEKRLSEKEVEKQHLAEQVTNLQRLLVKSEDEKDISMTESARYQRQLNAERSTKQYLEEKREQMKQKDLEDLQDQMMTLRVELGEEKKRRGRLEDLYNKRDDQVSQLRSTFDQSLNTLSKDTKNIKSILGKSLKKIDREIIGNNVAEDDDATISSETTFGDSDYSPSARPYLNLPRSSHRGKSLESPGDESRHKFSTPKVTAKPSPSSTNYVRSSKTSPYMVTSSIPNHYSLTSHMKESPVRDTTSHASKSKGSRPKRYSK